MPIDAYGRSERQRHGSSSEIRRTEQRTERSYFHAVSGVKLVDEAAFIEFLNESCVNETLGLEIGHGGIAQFHQTLHVIEAFRGRIRFSIRGTKQILVALLGEVGLEIFSRRVMVSITAGFMRGLSA